MMTKVMPTATIDTSVVCRADVEKILDREKPRRRQAEDYEQHAAKAR